MAETPSSIQRRATHPFSYIGIRWRAWRNRCAVLADRTPYEHRWGVRRKVEEMQLIRDIEASQLDRLHSRPWQG